ncbi:GNAT family N-acetyltransferase [Actinacidiphila sp. ITFR-21]|uniref:GNAT family N-acetyltransferase n=1 Tax=Actinacidiphila sp. ITFR-21 TaxID=3075199 RepID=UPI00288C128E|nr:GNAT family N-acetyltransferase [Streptomyces sp. ITFR-21]WNI20152.1 GNAT family N-acetyltransferase [Streptomyces sp. ITFR-21]
MNTTRTRLPGITIRDAGRPDADAVLRLVAAANPEDPDAFESARPTLDLPPIGPLSHFRALVVLAQDSSGEPVGALLGGAPVWLFEHEGIGHPALLDLLVARIGIVTAVGVHPDHRGQGVGAELVRHAVRRFTRAGYGLVTLNCVPSLERYYRRLGFTTMDTLNVHLGAGYMIGQQWGDTKVAARPLDRYTALTDVPGLASPVVSGILPDSGVPRGARFDGRTLLFRP